LNSDVKISQPSLALADSALGHQEFSKYQSCS